MGKQYIPWGVAAGGGGGGGYTQKQTQGNDTDNNGIATSDSSNFALASSFVASSSYGLKKVSVRLKKTGTPAYNIVAEIWSDAAGVPSAIIGSASTTVIDVTTLTGSYADYEFIFPSDIALTNGTKYHVVIRPDAVTSDASNYLNWSGNPAGSGTHFGENKATLVWGLVQASMDGSLTTFSSP